MCQILIKIIVSIYFLIDLKKKLRYKNLGNRAPRLQKGFVDRHAPQPSNGSQDVENENKKKLGKKMKAAKSYQESTTMARIPEDLYREFKIVCLASDFKPITALTEIVRTWTTTQKKKIGLVYTPPKEN